ncbi:MAG TPA: M20/M25/M40 family metallo-hydrolase [Anaerolineae bacterium]|nr:M20/M25/M40 family metallo-hydrolase [Anaerolineae bacterium]HQI85894.1 M20/M25/M40 family metallo-hydrolase [Anaerolineae bacterium]
MTEVLLSDTLLLHVRKLAEEIGPRPAGHPAEMRARQYIRQVLCELGYDEIETLPFLTPDTWGYALGNPLALTLASNLLGTRSRVGRVLGGALALACAYTLWRSTRIDKQPLAALSPRRHSATLIARVPPTAEPRRILVLLAHTDSNKHRPSFSPQLKKYLLGLTTAGLAAIASNGVAQMAEALTGSPGAARFRKASLWAVVASLLIALYDETGPYVPGASDNASAVACVLGLAAQLREQPLRHTEVWLTFTGAEEVGCLGTHALLDAYGDKLRDAWFLDLEMVGTEQIAYVTRHTGFSLISAYRPDAESLARAERVSRQHPEMGIRGRDMVIGEEVGALRVRGYRGICLSGFGADGWLENWHQTSDNVKNLVPAGLEKAARFAWAMMQELDG